MTPLETAIAWALDARNRPGPARASRDVIEAVCVLCEEYAEALLEIGQMRARLGEIRAKLSRTGRAGANCLTDEERVRRIEAGAALKAIRGAQSQAVFAATLPSNGRAWIGTDISRWETGKAPIPATINIWIASRERGAEE